MAVSALPLMIAAMLGGGALQDLLPGPPALSPAERAAIAGDRPAPVSYQGPPAVAFPALPLQVFGLRYAADLVIVSEHPDWDMHEYARIDLPSGSIWVAKDADRDKVQTITAPLDAIETWLPEIPAPRVQGPLTVDDRSTPERLDVRLSYTNPHGQPVEVEFQARTAPKVPPKRNGNTMGHSRQMAAVVLDLSSQRAASRAKIRIDGKDQKIHRVFGLVPMRFLLDQTQAGVVITRFRAAPADNGFTLSRPGDGSAWPTRAEERWTVTPAGQVELVRHHNGVAGFTYRFLDGGLASATVTQVGVDEPVLQLTIDPALPDLRRPFEGVVESRFSMDVHGQQGHGTGLLRARWEGEAAVLELIPTAPRWLADRPMRTTLRYPGDGSVLVETTRIDQPVVQPDGSISAQP